MARTWVRVGAVVTTNASPMGLEASHQAAMRAAMKLLPAVVAGRDSDVAVVPDGFGDLALLGPKGVAALPLDEPDRIVGVAREARRRALAQTGLQKRLVDHGECGHRRFRISCASAITSSTLSPNCVASSSMRWRSSTVRSTRSRSIPRWRAISSNALLATLPS